MTNNDICDAAIYLCGESLLPYSGDYRLRAQTLLALIYNECAPLDTAYRKAHDLPDGAWTDGTTVDLIALFPLSDPFTSAVTYALGSFLVSDENSELSALLYARYVAYLDGIRREIPAVVEPIADKYHFF